MSKFTVVGGEVDLNRPVNEMGEPNFQKQVHVVGAYADYQDAYNAWKANAWQTVDNALMRYFILPDAA